MLYKAGKKNLEGNYRSYLGKFLEKVVAEKLSNWTESSSKMNWQIKWFRKKVGSQTKTYLNCLKQLNMIFAGWFHHRNLFDVKKDFSHVWFDGLLFKPTTMGLNRKLIRWIINSFNQLNNNQLNDPITSIYGIPQGRPPFPIPFIFYVNGICQPIDAQVNLSQFLSDIVIWVQAASIRSVNFSLEKILEPTNWKTLKNNQLGNLL